MRADAAYLHYITLMNQVVMMGTQIYHDACDTAHHKYVAHQIALLYVSVCVCVSALRVCLWLSALMICNLASSLISEVHNSTTALTPHTNQHSTRMLVASILIPDSLCKRA